ncbi:universal stress protein [Paraburkholderia sp. BL10I2N1]|uniref:universal stress protein n=1 Tax=Paraburkholderia sp. BL10I2N1 TaxID=1938796 RepID=UPI00326071E1
MQIAYLGFAGSTQIEAEAGAQFVRLERFAKHISGCHLAIEATAAGSGHRQYEVRLILVTRTNDLIPVEHSLAEDSDVALRMAFDAAVRLVEQRIGRSGISPAPDMRISQSVFSGRFNHMEQTVMYDHMLVAVDGSESSKRALAEAISMASVSQGKITAVYVLESSTTFAYAGEYDPLALTRAMRSDGERVLADARAQMAQHDVAGDAEIVETEGLSEDVASCLQRTLERIGADLVVLGTHGRRRIRRMVIGSVAERFVRFSTCPVLLVREGRQAL